MQISHAIKWAVCVLAALNLAVVQARDLVVRNGVVLTMNDSMPRAGAVAVRDGYILAVGSEADALGAVADDHDSIDLGGKTLLPGFVDSHGHAFGVGLQASVANLLPPPDGEGADIEALINLLRDWSQESADTVERIDWIVGFGYDNAQLAEQRHPTRDDLDRVSTDFPVLVIHQSGHLGAVNSKALASIGITADTPDPPGGVYRRREGSTEPNGVLEEYALFGVLFPFAAGFDDEFNDQLVIKGTRTLASFGYTTAQEGRATATGLQAMRRVAERGELAIDLVSYPDVLAVKDIEVSREYRNNYRVAGVKLTIAGSPQGKTAWLSHPYHVPPAGQTTDYDGYAAIDEETTLAAIDGAFAKGWQILVHSNGDAATDRLLAAIEQSQSRYPDVDNRPVLIHGQVLRRDQVQRLDELGIFPSLFPMHTFYWGDWHRDSVLGPERADNISPTGWLMERNMKFASHHDAPVALPDSMRVLSATVTRRSRSGDILGPTHRVPVETALKAMTIWPAWQHFEEDSKGSLEVGKLADFVVLSADPTGVPGDKLADLHVVQTFKRGELIYQRPE